MGRNKTTTEVVDRIAKIYEESFGGKDRGRFQMSRQQFGIISGRKKVHESFISDVSDECLDRGYILIYNGEIFAIIEESVVLNYRTVPKKLMLPYILEDDEKDDDTPDDDDD